VQVLLISLKKIKSYFQNQIDYGYWLRFNSRLKLIWICTGLEEVGLGMRERVGVVSVDCRVRILFQRKSESNRGKEGW